MGLNPFEFAGPAFLLFYLVTGSAVLWAYRYWVYSRESEGEISTLALTDPFEIAFLRGGPHEAIRIAVISLVDRGLLKANKDTLKTQSDTSKDQVRRPLEKAILERFVSADLAWKMFDNLAVSRAAEAYRDSLQKRRLFADDRTIRERAGPFSIAMSLLLGLAGFKITVAISNGRHNFVFLMLLAGVVAFILTYMLFRKRTGMGDRVIEDLQTLFSGLRRRAHMLEPGGMTNEVVLLAAVFGIQALNMPKFAFAKKLFPQAASGNGSSVGCGSSGCSSVSGGSCSSGSSSSCGGGGGCGGCGGGGGD